MTHQVGPCIGDIAKIIVEANYLTLRRNREFRKDLKNKSYTEIAEKLNKYYEQEVKQKINCWAKRIERREQREEQRVNEKLDEGIHNKPREIHMLSNEKNEEEEEEIIENEDSFVEIGAEKPKSKRRNYVIQQREIVKSVSMDEIIKRNAGFENFINKVFQGQQIEFLNRSYQSTRDSVSEFREALFRTLRQRVRSAKQYIKEKEEEDKAYIDAQRQKNEKISIPFKQINQEAAKEAKKVTAYSNQAWKHLTEKEKEEIRNDPGTKRMQNQAFYENKLQLTREKLKNERETLERLRDYLGPNNSEVRIQQELIKELERQEKELKRDFGDSSDW
jgi:hypothetical protein